MFIQSYNSTPSYEIPTPDFWSEPSEQTAVSTGIPALADTLVQLELLYSEQAVDLDAVSRLVRSDLGLCLHLLRRARQGQSEADSLWRISDCVVDLGRELLSLAPLPFVSAYMQGYSEAEAFWKHASLVAACAEHTARCFPSLGVDPEQAYLGGLLHNIERLPRVLELAGGAVAPSPASVQSWLLDANLPAFIYEVLGSAREERDPAEMTPLARVVRFSARWIDICLPWSETCMARRSRFKLQLLPTAALIQAFFPEFKGQPVSPFMETLKDCTLDHLPEQRPESASILPRRRLSRASLPPIVVLGGRTSAEPSTARVEHA